MPVACRKGCAVLLLPGGGHRAGSPCHCPPSSPSALRRQLRRVQQRVHDAHNRTRGMARQQRKALTVACPLLAENRCSVYSVRPIQCRGCHSFDAKVCEVSTTTRKISPHATAAMDWRRKSVTDATLRGLCDGIAQARLTGRHSETQRTGDRARRS